MRIEVICQNVGCQKPFYVNPYRFKKYHVQYCSKACRRTKESIRIPVVCANPICGETFLVYPSSQPQQKCCSRACDAALRTAPLPERLWSKIQRCAHEDPCLYCCWLWQGCLNEAGYGCLSTTKNNKRSMLAHRLAWEEWNNTHMPSNRFACHYCHTPQCCNPMHIYAGTSQQNVNDTIKAKRHSFGERNGHAKLCEADIPHIFSMYQDGISSADIAKKFHISQGRIISILHQKQWLSALPDDIDTEKIAALLKANIRNRGSKNPASKLKESDIQSIFDMAYAGMSQRAIAAYFRVSQHAITQVLLGNKWTHVPVKQPALQFDPSIIAIATLPSIAYHDTLRLPHVSALYFIFQESNVILYVGRSADIYERLKVHRALRHFADVMPCSVAFHCLPSDKLLQAEIAAIQYFKPLENHMLRYRV